MAWPQARAAGVLTALPTATYEASLPVLLRGPLRLQAEQRKLQLELQRAQVAEEKRLRKAAAVEARRTALDAKRIGKNQKKLKQSHKRRKKRGEADQEEEEEEDDDEEEAGKLKRRGS